MSTSRRFLSLLTLSLAAGLAACAPTGLTAHPADSTAPASTTTPPDATVSATASASLTATPTPTPVPTPTPMPSPEPTTPNPAPASVAPLTRGTDLKPGTNHNHDAGLYVYSARDVEQWLHGKDLPAEKLAFLTFDDGPNPVTTPKILRALRDGDAHATFYVIGSEVEGNADLLKREITEGHSINLHSYSHNYRRLYPKRVADPDRIALEADKSLAALRAVFGKEFSTEGWRYPGGHMSWRQMGPADKALHARGLHWIDWNADSRDSAPKAERPRTVAALTAEAVRPIAAGLKVAVVLCHDTPDKALTAEAVPAIIKAYREAGYRFGVIS